MSRDSENPDDAPAGKRWHTLDQAELLRALETNEAGLSSGEAAARQRRLGRNILPRAKRPGLATIYVSQFKNPLIYILLAAAAVSLAIGEATDAAFIFGVLQLNALIGTVQESRAASSAAALDALVKSWNVTRRGGGRDRIDGGDLVPGDIVELESGDKVPADVRLLKSIDLAADQSLLTGESLPVAKDAEIMPAADAPVAERANMLYAGTTVLRGRALGAVVAIAAETEIGRIAEALAFEETPPPPLVLRLDRFTRAIGLAMTGAIAILAVAQYLQGVPPAQIFFVAVALAVAAIPEGLPVAITVTLAIATNRMARRNVIVRSLPAVEGLGACTLIASDKTGTLTCNKLTVKRLFVPGSGDFEVAGEGTATDGSVRPLTFATDGNMNDRAIRRIAVAGALCNEAGLKILPDGVHHIGDTVDVAFLVLAAKLGLDRDRLREDYPELGRVPFEPARRFAASFNRKGEQRRCTVKGAAEVVLPMCAGLDRAAILEQADRLAAAGYRVLAVAEGEAKSVGDEAIPPAEALGGLEFLGLVGLIDPLRPGAPAAVRQCREAGIDVRMITGDHPETALAIARDLGMAEARAEVVTGADLRRGVNVSSARVFARVEPMQKLSIVDALKRDGHFVAVTGDGVNDAPALRAAHIGVAMGRGGTDVARDAADLILTDDNFASIVGGVEEGRIAYDNVRKVVLLLISTGAAEIMLFVLAIAAGLPFPLYAAQLLWLNLVTQGIQDVALAFERGEPGVLRRPPRPPEQRIFDRRMIEQTIVSGGYMGLAGFLFFDWCLAQGWSEAAARNALLLLMVLFENVHIFNCRSETRSVLRIPLRANPLLMLAVIAAQAAHLTVLYVPGFFQDVLKTAPVDGRIWFIVAGLALSLVLVMEVYKRVRATQVV